MHIFSEESLSSSKNHYYLGIVFEYRKVNARHWFDETSVRILMHPGDKSNDLPIPRIRFLENSFFKR